MGVPKFFRFISERYPCLSELVKEYQLPEFDNLYLDMNGIVHMCSHPDDNDPHFRITEERIFKDIFHYIEVLFQMIKPQKVFFMAIDGVAPRAKMNQQRGRRFRTAKESEKLEAKAREKGEVLPTEGRFDSNCITPGTVFMARLHEQLKYFITDKITKDPLWQTCKVILSGHETPGEGEHKIMDYIRHLRSQPEYDPNTRHCLYGLDADLIILGLCTHDPHFSLLREEIKFGSKANAKRKNIPEEINFFLLHLSLMREYLEQEFIELKDKLPFGFNIENIIDDWVLMGFLVGNDFIPNLPNLHIANGALPLLYATYIRVLPTLDGYINEGGHLNLVRFEKFMETLCAVDMDSFTEQYADLKYFESKTGRRPNDQERTSYKPRKLEEWQPDESEETKIVEVELEEVKPTMKSDLAALIKATEDFLEPSEENLELLEDSDMLDTDVDSASSTFDDMFHAEFKMHKRDYYMNKLEYAQVTPEVLRSQAEGYVRAIQWNLNYYYNGVCSWSWYYPHHYAPFISDIKDFKDLIIEFDYAKPFHPYEQLLAVLPTASKKLLPECYHSLMEDENSPIKDYYPVNFQTDLNGKKQEWEAIVLIPFIDEKRLLNAMATCNDKLTEEEVKRNQHGPMLIYEYTLNDLGDYEAPEFFPSVKNNHALCTKVTHEDIRVPVENLIKGAYPGALYDVFYPGFPTMKHLKYKSTIKKAHVAVFDQASRNENLVILVENETTDDLKTLADKMLGQTVFVAWPHLTEALIISLSNEEERFHHVDGPEKYTVEKNTGIIGHNWNIDVDTIDDFYMNRLGVDVGDTKILAYVKVMTGRKYTFTAQGRVTLEKQWSPVTKAYPWQTIVTNINCFNPSLASYHEISDIFPKDSHCYMLGMVHYGAEGIVQDSKDLVKKCRVRVTFEVQPQPDLRSLERLQKSLETAYVPVNMAVDSLRISRKLFSRITGTMLVIAGAKRKGPLQDAPKYNVGLNLKFNKKNEEIPGYTRKGYSWLYSYKAVKLVGAFRDEFPQLFDFLEDAPFEDVFEDEIYPEDHGSGETLKKITAWIKAQPYTSVERQSCGSQTIEPDVVKELEYMIDEWQKTVKSKPTTMHVKPNLLYKPGILMGNVPPDQRATFQLYDRVVSVRASYTVPLGSVGTIIGIHSAATGKPDEVIYDIVFDIPFAGGLAVQNCSNGRGFKMTRMSLINKSYGTREVESKTGKPGQLLQKIGYSAGLNMSTQQQSHQFQQKSSYYGNRPNNSAFAWANKQPPNAMNIPTNSSLPPENQQVPAKAQARPSDRKRDKQNKRDFMPKFTNSPVSPSVPDTPIKLLQRQPESVPAPSTSAPETVSNQPEAQSPSMTAQDLIAHVSAQMQKMNLVQQQPSPIANGMAIFSGPSQPPTQSFCIQLLNEFQLRRIGYPNYQYVRDPTGNQYQARLEIPMSNEIITSGLFDSIEEASENVAEIALKKLPSLLANPIQFPAPPPSWCMPFSPAQVQQFPSPQQQPPFPIPQQQLPFPSPQQQQPPFPQQQLPFPPLQQQLPFPLQQQPFSPQKQQQPPPFLPPQQQQHQPIPPQVQQQQQQQPIPKVRASNAPPSSVPFVPLQAVKQQRIHKKNASHGAPSAKETARKEVKEKPVAKGSGQQQQQQQQEKRAADKEVKENQVAKPRRQRKSRIAANFAQQP